MGFFTFIFYLLALIPIILEFITIKQPDEMLEIDKRNIDLAKTEKDEDKVFNQLNFFYFIWTIIGIFSSQWILFLLIIALSLLPKRTAAYTRFDAIISLGILLFIILNKAHFHINLFNLIFS